MSHTGKRVGDVDLVSVSLAQEDTEGALLCVFGNTVVVIDHGEEDEGVYGDQ